MIASLDRPYRLIPFRSDLVVNLRLQSAQQPSHVLSAFTDDDWKMVERSLAFGGFKGERLLACGGIIPQWTGRAALWLMLAEATKGYDMLWIFRTCRTYLDEIQTSHAYNRLEATVDVGFKQGHRFARLLGFKAEGLLRKYAPDGHDHIMYARIKHG